MSTISITRKYTPGDGKQYAQFVDAARAVDPKKLTLYPQLNPAMWGEGTNEEGRTIFQEVSVVPFEEANPDAVVRLRELPAPDPHAPETVTRLLDMNLNALSFSDAFLGVLARDWPGGFAGNARRPMPLRRTSLRR